MCKSFFAFNETIVIYLLTLINKFKKMPTPKKPMAKKGNDPKPKTSSKSTSSKSYSLGGGKMGSKAQQDSVMMSRGYTPSINDTYLRPTSKSQVASNKAKAAKSNPAKTGKSPR